MGTRWKKVTQDFSLNKSRTVLVILAIFLGIFASGLILNCYSITKREMDISYMNTNPASFTLNVDPIDNNLLESLENFSGIQSVEVRRMVRARSGTETDSWKQTELYVIDDFHNITIDKFLYLDGKDTPELGEILIEKGALSVANVSIGDSINVKTPLNVQKKLTVSGSVKAPGMHPAWMDELVYGYITQGTLDLLGVPSDYGKILFVVSGDQNNENHIRNTAFAVRDWCDANGYNVSRVQVPTPGKHPNGDQMNAILFLFQVFGILSLILSGVLIINLISSLLNGQIKQIAIMKAIGASKWKIAALYYILVSIFGVIAILFAIPMAASMSKEFVNLFADMLNFTVTSYRIPIWSYLLQISAGLLIPAAAASYPIIKACRISVNDALHDVGMSKKNNKKFKIKNSRKITGISRPLLLSLRNTFRQRGRLLFTLCTLAIGGAILMVSINVRASLANTFDKSLENNNFDTQFTLSKNYMEEDIRQALSNIPEIALIECFSGSMASFIYENKTESNFFQSVAIPENTVSINLPVIKGRWISNDDTNAVVINQGLSAKEPDISVGDSIPLKINGKVTDVTVIGIVKEVGGTEKAYLSQDFYQQTFSENGEVRNINITHQPSDDTNLSTILLKTEKVLRESNIDVLTSISIKDAKSILSNHLITIASFLVIASIMVIIVGVMGLISSTELNVLERMREIGIMRSIGAMPRDILHMIIYENLFIGFISWLLACITAVPLSTMIGNTFGNIFLKTTLDNIFDPSGMIIWFLLIMIINIVVSIIAIRKAMRLPVNKVLSYE